MNAENKLSTNCHFNKLFLLLFTKQVSNQKFCLELCKSRPDCNWFTFSPVDTICHIFKTCARLDLEICPDCRSGQRNCSEPKCNLQGECNGMVVEHSVMTYTARDCLKLCKSTSRCSWYTFYKEYYKCILFESCSTIDSTCGTCVSGQKACTGITFCYISTFAQYFHSGQITIFKS